MLLLNLDFQIDQHFSDRQSLTSVILKIKSQNIYSIFLFTAFISKISQLFLFII